jgi:hypothetical protein
MPTAGIAAGCMLAVLVGLRPKFIKWHLVTGTAFMAIFLSSLGAADQNRKALAEAFLVLFGIGQGYSLVLSYVLAPLTAQPQDLGLVVGLFCGIRGLSYSDFQAAFANIVSLPSPAPITWPP